MEKRIDELPEDIHEISSNEFNVLETNSIEWRYAEQRQRSKAPTFALT